MLGGGRADLKTSEEDLVTVLPQDEGTDGTDEGLGQVQHDLDQKVDCECPGDHITVTGPLEVERTGYWVIVIQFADAVFSQLFTAKAAGL